MTTRRQLKNEVNDLTGDDDGDGRIVINLTGMWEKGEFSQTRGDSPHPELTTERHPDSDRHDALHLAIPSVWPSGFPTGIVLVHACDSYTDEWPSSEERSNKILACELWDSLSEAQLEHEYELRQEQGEPIPPILEPYGEE